MKSITVIGSINIDISLTTNHFTKIGETNIANNFKQDFGGKGANQAIALSKLGLKPQLIGTIGDDIYGQEYLKHLQNNNINTSNIIKIKNINTGMAFIEVSSGNNRIIINSGANSQLNEDNIKAINTIDANSIVLLQLEIPLNTTLSIVKQLKKQGSTIILDPAPANKEIMNQEFLENIDYITPNESETQELCNTQNPQEAWQIFSSLGVKNLILKQGKNGCTFINHQETLQIKSFKVKEIDSTSAGDSFNAGFTYGLFNNLTIKESLKIANSAGAIACTRYGTQSSMANLKEIMNLINQKSY